MPADLASIKVSDIMSKVVLTAEAGETIHTAVKKMAVWNVGAIVVAGKDGGVLGIFTERDLMNKVVGMDKDPRATRLSDVMTQNLRVVGPDDSLAMVYQFFRSNTFRHLPVLDKNKKLSGIVSIKDVLKAISEP